MTQTTNTSPPLTVGISREAEIYHAGLRVAWAHILNTVLPAIHERAEAECESEGDGENSIFHDTLAAKRFLDDMPEFQMFSWFSRHGQRLRYYEPEFGAFAVVERDREQLVAQLEESAGSAGSELRLDPEIELPGYLRWADFHQHHGGTWSDDVGGLVYETARRLAFLTETGDRNIYRWSYDMLPKDAPRARMLDWGTGHGAGALEWKRMNPDSETHGVDLSAPCLKLAHQRAREQGLEIFFSQQNVEELDFPDDHFDVAFHIFMFHEIPPRSLEKALREMHRVLKPGGRFCGPESCLSERPEYLRVIQDHTPWLLDEIFFNAWHRVDFEAMARDVGFSQVIVEPWSAAFSALDDHEDRQLNKWNYFQLVK
jgi:SAM-dependent methyltransferase